MTRGRFVGLLVVGVVLHRWFSDEAAPPAPRTLQAAVMANGFGLIEGTGTDRHVLGFDDDGTLQFRHAVPLTAPDVRVVGSRVGPVVGWRNKAKLELAQLTGDGEVGAPEKWGKAVQLQCDGVATNEHQFGLGWADKDQQIWFVYGPTGKARAFTPVRAAELEATAKPSWCGIASAHKEIVLMWREGSRTFATFCTSKECDMFMRLPLDKRHTLLGVGCTQDACLLAVRKEGSNLLAWVRRGGNLVWTKPLADAAPDTTFSIVGAGDRAIAVGYLTNTGATVQRVIASGSMQRAWHDPSAHEVPSLAWARDRLFVAQREEQSVIALPR
ncbi:MAG: hypothetical protein SFX73_02705 [Kofleriaceae bacterium]|nr:hypothetical protein [Kofleriaceae bacterium]